MYLLTPSKNSISGLELARQPGVRPDTAALMRHKLMPAMVEREGSRKLDGRVEMVMPRVCFQHDVVLGGEKSEADGAWRQARAFGTQHDPFRHSVGVLPVRRRRNQR